MIGNSLVLDYFPLLIEENTKIPYPLYHLFERSHHRHHITKNITLFVFDSIVIEEKSSYLQKPTKIL